jgi:hypothetical protein
MSSIERMINLLGEHYQIVTQEGGPIVLENPDGSPDLAIEENNESDDQENFEESPLSLGESVKKTTEDYLFQIYVGSLTVVGLFVLFRMIRKSH